MLTGVLHGSALNLTTVCEPGTGAVAIYVALSPSDFVGPCANPVPISVGPKVWGMGHTPACLTEIDANGSRRRLVMA
jgi:hypothetical protein